MTRTTCRDMEGEAEQTLLNEYAPAWVTDVAVDVSKWCLQFTKLLLSWIKHDNVSGSATGFPENSILRAATWISEQKVCTECSHILHATLLCICCNSWTCVFSRDRLSASDMLVVRKVMEHIYEKIVGQNSDAGSQTAAGAQSSGHASASQGSQQERSDAEREAEEMSQAAEEHVEILCNDQASGHSQFLFRKLHWWVKNKCSVFSVQVLDPSMDLRTVKHFIWKQSSDIVLQYRFIPGHKLWRHCWQGHETRRGPLHATPRSFLARLPIQVLNSRVWTRLVHLFVLSFYYY